MTDPTTPTEPPEAAEAAEAAVQRPRRGAAIAIAGVQVGAAVVLIAVLLLGGRGQSDPAPPAEVSPEPSPSATVGQVEKQVDDVLAERVEDGSTEPVYDPVDPAALPEPVLSGDLEDEQVDPEAFATFTRSVVALVCSYPEEDAVAAYDRLGDAGVQLYADQQVIDSRSMGDLGYARADRLRLDGTAYVFRHVAEAYAYPVPAGFQVDLSPRVGVDVTALIPASPACS